MEQFLDQDQPLASCPITITEMPDARARGETDEGVHPSLLFCGITEEIAPG
jgi:hypothetical protein